MLRGDPFCNLKKKKKEIQLHGITNRRLIILRSVASPANKI